MSIKIKSSYGTTVFDSIESMFKCKLDGSDYDNGQFEAMVDTAENNSQAIGRLVTLLYNKNIISLEEAANVAYYVGSDTIEEVGD